MTKMQVGPLLGKRLLVITAHPDDESYGCAGTLALHAQAGAKISLICATYGEKGQSHLPAPISQTTMKTRRARELKAAARVIGIRRVRIIGIPDGELRYHKPTLAKAVQAEARRQQPDAIISFGKDGISGHHDHIAAGQVAHALARFLHLPFAAITLPPVVQRSATTFLRSRRRSPHYTKDIGITKPNRQFTINGLTKMQALQCHASQLDKKSAFENFPASAVRILMRKEYFRIWNN
jgi:LmbE family N-acetylglucosaminyl deacetylase